MHDELMLLHHFINEIAQLESEEELDRLYAQYQERLGLSASESENVLCILLQDMHKLGAENLFLKSCGADITRNRKLAALTAKEREEFAEVGIIIDENRFGYHFQPIVSATDGSIYSYEALMRPKNDMGLTPFHILKYAELTGRLNDIESATFLNVLNLIDSNKAMFRDRRVFINSIPKMKLSGSDFKRVGELLMKHSDTAVVEITEQTESDDEELNALKERYLNMGVKIAIDDYGTGYSNVSNLLRYMPNYVKIDRSLISEIQDSPKKRHFVREIIEFCHGNGIKALAEGVETSEELHTVILLGVDLIQGFYTARPAAELLDDIPYEIRQEIKVYQRERQDGRDQQIYGAVSGERIQLEKLMKDVYKCILADSSGAEDFEVTVVGAPAMDTEIHVETAEGFKGRIILENAHLSNVKNRPCIDLGENSDVTLVLKGENKLDKSGIRVPESARLTVEGDGILLIGMEGAEYFGIGNGVSSGHGDLIFNQSGLVRIATNGRTGVGIGAGHGGNITVNRGKLMLKMSGFHGVGIGSLDDACKLNMNTGAIDADVSFMKGVAVGSMNGSAELRLSKAMLKLYVSGEEIAVLGTVNGDNAGVFIQDAVVDINLRSNRSTCVGSLHGKTECRIENAAFRVTAVGEQALPLGGFSGDFKAALVNADATVKMETGLDLASCLAADKVEVVGGRTSFFNHEKEIDISSL